MPNRNVQLTYESGKKSIAFLDLDVALCNGQLQKTVCVKPIDRYQYLQYLSSHPEHMRRSIVFSQTLYASARFETTKKYWITKIW